MLVNGTPYRTIWLSPTEEGTVCIIDQNRLPWDFQILKLTSTEEVARAIRDMQVRGAGLIGATAAYGMHLAALESEKRVNFLTYLKERAQSLCETRPTAVNLAWAVERQMTQLRKCADSTEAIRLSRKIAEEIADEDAESCRQIGIHGLDLIRAIANRKGGEAVNILTHCNAGWLAFVDFGSATAPIYAAHDAGIPVHVWVDETRPRNQGARLTAWELAGHGVPHTVIADNTGGHLMQHGMVDLVITGADRVTRLGDVANKIGTYLKALAARDNGVPFYVALPMSTFDLNTLVGLAGIPIEQRSPAEVTHMEGQAPDGTLTQVRIFPEASPAANYAFDVTPARLISGLITPQGICPATENAITQRIHWSKHKKGHPKVTLSKN